METLTVAEVRRAALAAQGFTKRGKQMRRVVEDTGLLQIDSVNVLQRAHYMPVYSRIGAYDTTLLDRASARKPRWLFEYWGHEASLLPVGLHRLMRWRMDQADRIWGGPLAAYKERPDLVKWVLEEIRDKGPVTAAAIERDEKPKSDNWGWRWSDTKKVLEALFYFGQITSAGRTTQFARQYDLPERVLPPEVLNAPTPTTEQAHRELVEIAARRLAVAAEVELRDYFRLPLAGARLAIQQLVEAGVLVPVEVKGWTVKAWRHRDAVIPRAARASTLISPFDPLIWERARTERLFGLNYRIEIYVPQAKRVHGYYVLPFLHGNNFAARVDLKADRQAGVLRVPAAWSEPGSSNGDTAEALAVELQRLAAWLGLSGIDKAERGDLATALNKSLHPKPARSRRAG